MSDPLLSDRLSLTTLMYFKGGGTSKKTLIKYSQRLTGRGRGEVRERKIKGESGEG